MKVYKSHLDSISIIVSTLCVVHCIILPIFLSTLPLWGIELLENSYIEIMTIFCTLLAGGWAIGRGYLKFHQHLVVPVLFVIGLVLMVIANYLDGELFEMLLKGVGAVFIIGAHITNWKKCNVCCENSIEKAKCLDNKWQ